jgi:multiple sugar transport system permease protein
MAIGTAISRRRRMRNGYAYVFVLPYIAFLLAFAIGPGIYAIYTSLNDTSQDVWKFNGVQNYSSVVNDFRFAPAVGNIFMFLLIWLPATALIVLMLSLLLHTRVGRFSSTMRLIYYIPGAITGSASVLLWLFMIDPLLSPFGPLLKALGFSTDQDVLSPGNLPVVYAVMSFTTSAGFWIVVIFGALMNISHEILESAIMDGANAFQTAFFIKIPLVARYLVFMAILSFAGGVQLFVEPQIMNIATTGTTSDTWSINQLAYKYAFTDGNFGTSAALAVLLLVVGVVVALLVILKTDFYRIDVGGQ